jgi:hypothetical protein
MARLRSENARLLRLLELTPAQARPPGPTQTGLFDGPPARLGGCVLVLRCEGCLLRGDVRGRQRCLRGPLGERPHRPVGMELFSVDPPEPGTDEGALIYVDAPHLTMTPNQAHEAGLALLTVARWARAATD